MSQDIYKYLKAEKVAKELGLTLEVGPTGFIEVKGARGTERSYYYVSIDHLETYLMGYGAAYKGDI